RPDERQGAVAEDPDFPRLLRDVQVAVRRPVEAEGIPHPAHHRRHRETRGEAWGRPRRGRPPPARAPGSPRRASHAGPAGTTVFDGSPGRACGRGVYGEPAPAATSKVMPEAKSGPG